MLFNSIDFAVFLPIVFILYWFVANRNLRFQNLLLIAAGYVFYGWWDWRFLLLLIISTVLDYSIGLALGHEQQAGKRRFILALSLFTNLGFLGIFKYFNFFMDNFVSAFSALGAEISPRTLNIILPVGISFYTFQSLSYAIDVYRRRQEPTSDFIQYAAFVSFFPQLLAGPIERATNMLPQFMRQRHFDYSSAVIGLKQILWGLFKKLVIADNCARFANDIFANYSSYSGSTLILGAIFFTFQIYGDFSGYSDIALGTARLFGFKLMRNFAFPYFSRDIAEFWRRWHISLSSWFRDYLYIPLGGSKGTTAMKVRNTFIVFLVSGFWHGSNWTFVVWGGLNAVYFLPSLLLNRNRLNLDTVAQGRMLPSLREFASMCLTFSLVTFAWIFFRAQDMTHAIQFIKGIFDSSIVAIPEFSSRSSAAVTMLMIVFFLIVEWIGREDQFAIETLGVRFSLPFRWAIYTGIIVLMGVYMANTGSEFIYFQF